MTPGASGGGDGEEPETARADRDWDDGAGGPTEPSGDDDAGRPDPAGRSDTGPPNEVDRVTGSGAGGPPDGVDNPVGSTRSRATTGENDASRRRGWLSTALGVAAWVLGPLLVALGAYGMSISPGAGTMYLLVGLLVTPRTRRELGELCRILCGAREE